MAKDLPIQFKGTALKIIQAQLRTADVALLHAALAELTGNSLQLARDILHGAGVAVTPGLDFDPVRGAQTLRFSYARATADIAEGLQRLCAYMTGR